MKSNFVLFLATLQNFKLFYLMLLLLCLAFLHMYLLEENGTSLELSPSGEAQTLRTNKNKKMLAKNYITNYFIYIYIYIYMYI